MINRSSSTPLKKSPTHSSSTR